MTSLLESRPEDLLRCGVVFGQVAEQLDAVVVECGRAAEVEWLGRAAINYRGWLGEVADNLGFVGRAYSDACDVLITYSRALVEAQELAWSAERLDPQLPATQLLLDPMGALDGAQASRAAELRAEAVGMEREAAARAATVLHMLSVGGPFAARGQGAVRWLAEAGQGLAESATGMLDLFGAGYDSLPFVGSVASRGAGRHDLAEAGKQTLQPWLQVEQLIDEVREHHSGLATGQLFGALILRKTHAESKTGKLFGFHDKLPESVLRMIYQGHPVDAVVDKVWTAEHLQRRFLADLRHLEQVPLPPLEQWTESGVDLTHHEAHGGHTILKHVGRDEAFLLKRQAAEANAKYGPQPFSSFDSLGEAGALIHRAVLGNAAEIRSWQRTSKPSLAVRFPVHSSGLVLDPNGLLAPARAVVVVIQRSATADIYVRTAYLTT